VLDQTTIPTKITGTTTYKTKIRNILPQVSALGARVNSFIGVGEKDLGRKIQLNDYIAIPQKASALEQARIMQSKFS
jgi:hypothetical protein